MNDKTDYSVDRTKRSPQLDVTSKEIDGISDLVVWAPIREGFIDAFNNVTYESRLRLVAEALHSLRKTAREFEKLEAFADTAKRIISLLDFRIGIVDRDLMGVADDPGNGTPRTFQSQKFMYLVATFDAPLEPYMRLIYDPLGKFLDLVLCNCQGYKPSFDHDFETYIKWVRDNQLDSAIFYSSFGNTVGDQIYGEEAERILRTEEKAFNKISRLTLTTPDKAAEQVQLDPKTTKKARRLGLEALNVLYKLTDLYPPNSTDGHYLIHAAHDLLRGLTKLLSSKNGKPLTPEELKGSTLEQPLTWFAGIKQRTPQPEELPLLEKSEIQKGLLSSYDDASEDGFWATHGALLLARITDPKKFRSFLESPDLFSWESGTAITLPGTGISFYLNIGFSPHGLEAAGVPEAEMAFFAKEFREGARARAPLIGDKYDNHPRNWTLPKRNWFTADKANLSPIDPSEVHFTLKFRTEIKDGSKILDGPSTRVDQYFDFTEGIETLEADLKKLQTATPQYVDSQGVFAELAKLNLENLSGDRIFQILLLSFEFMARTNGFSILGIESMSRQAVNQSLLTTRAGPLTRTQNRDHFGFLDGLSQPIIDENQTHLPPSDDTHPMTVLLGDILYGYPNTRHDPHRDDHKERLAFNGSYLVVRKIRQNVGAFKKLEQGLSALTPPLTSELLLGRSKDGTALVAPSDTDNAFIYKGDPEGEMCPLSAHIRLANPRSHLHKRRDPKILRRGMSYGEPYSAGTESADRGVMFMAYCASIAEQYEVIQRWLNGGNSTGVNALRNDPLTGGLRRTEKDTHTFVVNTPGGDSKRIQFNEALTTLQWTDYFFVPSRTALHRIAQCETDPIFTQQRSEARTRRLNLGSRVLTELEDPQLATSVGQQKWKVILEDFLTKDPTEHNITPQIMEAIEHKGGVYRIKDGIAFDNDDHGGGQGVILVTNAELIASVLDTDAQFPNGPYSCEEQKKRINTGFGTIYVCLDGDQQYYDEATETNATLMKQSRETAFATGYTAAIQTLEALQKEVSDPEGKFKIELSRQFIQPATANLCWHWYGIPDGTHILKGAWDWRDPQQDRGSLCPGDFLSPSRQTFYPRPTSTISEFGRLHGRALNEKARAYVESIWDNTSIQGYIAQDIFEEMKRKAAAEPDRTEYYKDLMVRNMIGGMVGAIPPMDGCLRWALFDWLREGTLWTYQSEYQSGKIGSNALSKQNVEHALNVVQSGLRTAMCIRPAPDLLYRTAKKDGHKIGAVDVQNGDMVVLCLSAATQKALSEGNNDVSLVFGGNRKLPDGTLNPNSGLHSCPAKDLAMGAMSGMLTGLLDFGTIKEMPASLIIEMSPR